MKIGIIAEGWSDIAVIQNILKGAAGIEFADCMPLRPSYNYDETDLAIMGKNPDSFGSWTNVMNDCKSQEKFEKFLSIEGQEFIIIHLDTAEVDKYAVDRPTKPSAEYAEYCETLRSNVINKISEWLGYKFREYLLYAIAIEETDAWILALYDRGDSVSSSGPKEKLKYLLDKRHISSIVDYKNYKRLSKEFSHPKIMSDYKWVGHNRSLELFCEEIKAKIKVPDVE